MHAGLWLGGIFGIAHVDSFGCTHILSTISDLNVGEELAQTGRSYVVRPSAPPPAVPAAYAAATAAAIGWAVLRTTSSRSANMSFLPYLHGH